MTKEDRILSNQDLLLEAMLNKDELTLRKLLHPEASVFGSAIHEFEKGIENVLRYYTEALALLPDDKRVNIKSRRFTDLNNQALVEQEFDIHFTLEGKEITLLTLRQTVLWTQVEPENSKEPSWLLLHDHTSMPDHLGAFETISTNELLEGNLNLEFETEKLKKKLNKSIADLKLAQDQLIQKEKLASIGQLAAGIAHEIKNPLNFVNNFSEVILELLEEARVEVKASVISRKAVAGEPAEKGGVSEGPSPLLEILDDIEANLQKIIEHGKRADSIVKSMLLHSRGRIGEPVPTNVNAMLDEYTKLAYHGMRASDPAFNVDIKTDFDTQIPLLNLIPQDISRAFLNIINNAMYAADEHGRTDPKNNPSIHISTSLQGKDAVIRIRDNGAGIPDEIRGKIFKPFFTTKPAGSGTGLGLSMSYDIVKMHNGSMSIDSEPGKYTEFTITLPMNQQGKK
jgi:signal transduction histidine kinase